MGEIYEARDFALKAHGDQRYGDEPYGVHLFDVVGIAKEFGATDAQWKAAFLHDVLEDTPVLCDEILDRFGVEVLSIVFACTGEGGDRRERNASIYRKIAAYPDAALVKLADRIANIEASPLGSHHRQRYHRENADFRAVIRPHVPEAMWERLERAFAGSVPA